jgi:hypothetical protein
VLDPVPQSVSRVCGQFAAKFAGIAKLVFVLQDGVGKERCQETSAALARLPDNELRVIWRLESVVDTMIV